jgi:60 kDa SS-A/Ro ribonucleoprotein
MSRFNETKKATTMENYSGTKAHQKSSELELVSILLTSFVDDQFYRNGNETINRISKCLESVDPEFAAKVAIFARNEFGMRSVTHVLASDLAKYVSGKSWGKEFYNKIIHRPDDMLEIVSFYLSKGNKSLPNSMKKGFAKAFERFNGYQLGKYKNSGKNLSLVDLANMVHPKPVDTNGFISVNTSEYSKKTGKTIPTSSETIEINSLDALMNGFLKSEGTWEAELSKAGKEASDENQKSELKNKVWNDLISTKKIGYFAALRNACNVIEQSPESVDLLCSFLTDEHSIKKSLVFPFRYMTAAEEVSKIGNSLSRKVTTALEKAIEISCSNVPKFSGETCVIFDRSLSMNTSSNGRSIPTKVGSVFAAILSKVNNADLILFGTDARYENYNPSDSVKTLSENLSKVKLGNTKFQKFFELLNKKYDRLIILSDGEANGQLRSSQSYLSQYCKTYNCDPWVYNFDLAGYPTVQFSGGKVINLAGFSEKVFNLMKAAEEDQNVLINNIKNTVKL